MSSDEKKIPPDTDGATTFQEKLQQIRVLEKIKKTIQTSESFSPEFIKGLKTVGKMTGFLETREMEGWAKPGDIELLKLCREISRLFNQKRKQIVQKARNEMFRVLELDPGSANTKSLTAGFKKAIEKVEGISKENTEEMAGAITRIETLQKNIEILSSPGKKPYKELVNIVKDLEQKRLTLTQEINVLENNVKKKKDNRIISAVIRFLKSSLAAITGTLSIVKAAIQSSEKSSNSAVADAEEETATKLSRIYPENVSMQNITARLIEINAPPPVEKVNKQNFKSIFGLAYINRILELKLLPGDRDDNKKIIDKYLRDINCLQYNNQLYYPKNLSKNPSVPNYSVQTLDEFLNGMDIQLQVDTKNTWARIIHIWLKLISDAAKDKVRRFDKKLKADIETNLVSGDILIRSFNRCREALPANIKSEFKEIFQLTQNQIDNIILLNDLISPVSEYYKGQRSLPLKKWQHVYHVGKGGSINPGPAEDKNSREFNVNDLIVEGTDMLVFDKLRGLLVEKIEDTEQKQQAEGSNDFNSNNIINSYKKIQNIINLLFEGALGPAQEIMAMRDEFHRYRDINKKMAEQFADDLDIKTRNYAKFRNFTILSIPNASRNQPESIQVSSREQYFADLRLPEIASPENREWGIPLIHAKVKYLKEILNLITLYCHSTDIKNDGTVLAYTIAPSPNKQAEIINDCAQKLSLSPTSIIGSINDHTNINNITTILIAEEPKSQTFNAAIKIVDTDQIREISQHMEVFIKM